jgi:beta-lactamase regulating signal transducer with metallopeptidase domain
MAGLSQSAFLQALGWATLNSFWQMALLWCCFVGANYFFNLSAAKKYFFSVTAVLGGAMWFVITFFLYYNGNGGEGVSLSYFTITTLSESISLVLTAASITYLLLLSIPTYRLFYNWRRVQSLKKLGLQKADIRYKLFVKKIAAQLGIKKNVGIYFSEMVKSPLTIGYLKPLILLPLASVNNLTVQQVEAVLLHELSHIRRFDYLVNILISIVHTLLYFNPFTRLFIKVAQEERENCCDQMVLQFGYDKVGYASALLSLEKTSIQSHSLVLAAAGKRNLLRRIEKIVGIEKKIVFQFNHFAGLLAAVLCVFAFNSLLIISKEKNVLAFSFNSLENPFYFFTDKESSPLNKVEGTQKGNIIRATKKQPAKAQNNAMYFVPDVLEPPPPPEIVQVAYDEVESRLSKEQKDHIKATIENTKKVLSTYQWTEVEKTIADGLTSQEKAAVKHEYLQQINKIDWKNMEKGLKTAYENINWPQIDANLKTALVNVQLDSLQVNYEQTLTAIEKVQLELKANAKPAIIPFPDESVEEINKRKEEVRSNLNEIRVFRSKKIIKL